MVRISGMIALALAGMLTADALLGPAMADETSVPDFDKPVVLTLPTQEQMDAVGPKPEQFDAVNKAVESLKDKDIGAELGDAVNSYLAGQTK